jgi:hypothetical protein
MFIPVTQFPLEFLTCEASHLFKMPSLEVWANLFWTKKKKVFLSIKKFLNFDFLCRGSVKAAFQSVPRKYQIDTSILRLNLSDCSNEVEDDMLPWLPEDFGEDTTATVVTIQWLMTKQKRLRFR